jgi:hypothetical protein
MKKVFILFTGIVSLTNCLDKPKQETCKSKRRFKWNEAFGSFCPVFYAC